MLTRKTYLIIIHYIFLRKVVQLFLECSHIKELNGFLFGHRRRRVYMTNLLIVGLGGGVGFFLGGVRKIFKII